MDRFCVRWWVFTRQGTIDVNFCWFYCTPFIFSRLLVSVWRVYHFPPPFFTPQFPCLKSRCKTLFCKKSRLKARSSSERTNMELVQYVLLRSRVELTFPIVFLAVPLARANSCSPQGVRFSSGFLICCHSLSCIREKYSLCPARRFP